LLNCWRVFLVGVGLEELAVTSNYFCLLKLMRGYLILGELNSS